MLGIILGILTFIVVMYFDVQSDYKRLVTNTIEHKRGAIVRAIALLFPFGCFYFPLQSNDFWFILGKVIIVGGMMMAWWWEFFDGWLNTKRGESWRFNGSDDENDAKTDNFLQKYSPSKQAIIKWSLIIVFTIIYIILNKKD